MQAVLTEPVVRVESRHNAFLLLLATNGRLALRNRAALFWGLLFPAVFMLFFGAINAGQTANPAVLDAPSFISFLVPGVIVTSLLSNGVIGNSQALAIYRERGILRRIQATPISPVLFLLSRIVIQALSMVIQALVLLAVAMIAFGIRYDAARIVLALPGIIIGALTFMALGQMVAALIRRPEAVALATQILYYPLIFLSGMLIPLSQLPPVLQDIGQWLPSAALATLLREALLGSTPGIIQLPLAIAYGVVALTFVLAVAIGAGRFRWN